MSCPFCAIVAGSEQASVVYADEAVVALCDLHPVNPGHLLVIPRAHADGLTDLAPADGARMFAVAQRLADALRATHLRCDGVDLFLADGAAAGQEVFHAHLHVIPRYPGDAFRIHTGRPAAAPRAGLDDVARTVRAALTDLPAPPPLVAPAAPPAELPPLVDPGTAADPTAAWTALITRYYDGCSTGDVALMLTTLHPDVVHWFLAPNTGSTAVAGAEHLARYWRKVAGMLQARWVVDTICATPAQAVIEWTMWWLPEGATERVATRGAEWFTCADGRIGEIRSYYQMRPETTQLDGFPYAERGYSAPTAERSAIHPAI